MPRLDNGSPKTWAVMAQVDPFPSKWARLTIYNYIEGDVEPVDICWNCYDSKGFYDCPEMDDHPPYEDYERYCVLCTSLLTEEDN